MLSLLHRPLQGLVLFGLLLTALPLQAQGAPLDPDTAAVAEANRLGHLIRTSDQAAWHGTDAVVPLMQADTALARSAVRGYVVEQVPEGWRLAMGRLVQGAMEVAFEAVLDTAYAVLETHAYPLPRRDQGALYDAMRAREAAMDAFVPPYEVTYNTVVLPTPDARFYVYLLPAQPAWDVFFVGCDVRYTYDPASNTLPDSTRLHEAVQTFDLRDPSAGTTVHRLPNHDLPSETDVFFAISRRANEGGTPHHLVIASTHVFFLGADGIRVWLTHEAFRRIGDHQESLRDERGEAPEKDGRPE